MVTNSAQTDDDDIAVRWAIRLDGEPLSEDEQRALDIWIDAKPIRRATLLRAEAALAYLDRGRALAEPVEVVSYAETPNARRYSARMGRRAFIMGSAATGLSAAAAIGFVMLTSPKSVEIQTAVGEIRRVPLADGSVASINTDSRVAVLLAEKRREVKLESGEAWFQVAHDKARPFIVEAGDIRVRAVGTAFSVRRRDGGADVLVTEGVVETWVVGREEHRTRIAAGSKSFVSDASTGVEAVTATDDLDRALAWRTGELALNGESLAYAVSEINRYNRRKLVIADPELGKEPLVGYFRADQPENFSRTVAKMVGAEVHIDQEIITITR